MAVINQNYGRLRDSYLFAGIRDRVDAFSRAHPDQRILRLGIGDVIQPLCPSVVNALQEAAREQGRRETFHGYMPECGDSQLRKAIAGYYRKRGINLKSEEVFVSSGASDELGDILHLFDRSLPALLTEPAYPAYADANVMEGREIRFLEAREEDGFAPEPPEEEITALIYLCSPNNPTGAVYSRDLLKRWVDYAVKTDSVILFDAAYEAFITDPVIPHSIFEIEGSGTCAIEISSLSKTAGFTGTRCGYTVIPDTLERDGLNLNAMWVRNRTTRTNGVSFILQRGALAVFTEEGQKEIQEALMLYRKNAEIFMHALDEAGIRYTGGKNAPYLWVKCPNGMGSWEMFDHLLNRAQIVGTPGEGFGRSGEGYFRFSMFADRSEIEEAGRRIRTLYK